MITTILFTILSCTNQPYEEELDDDYSSSVLEPKITSLILIDAESNKDLAQLSDNSSFSQSAINVRAEGDAGSVIFQLSGRESYKQTDNKKPFSLKGDDTGIYDKWVPNVGDYILKVTPYSRKNGKGSAGSPLTVKFSVNQNTTGRQPIKLYLVDYETQQRTELKDGIKISQKAINIAAVPMTQTDVTFQLSGAESLNRTEKTSPYALKGDNGIKFNSWMPTVGNYTLKVITALDNPVTVNFSVEASTSSQPEPIYSNELYFGQDFSGVTLTGTGESRKFTGWNILGATSYLSDASIWAVIPGYTDARMEDGFDNGRRTLRFQVNDDSPNDSWITRTQMTMTFKDNVDIGIYHTSQRMYISPDLASLSNYPGSINWLCIFEVWNKRNPNWDGENAGSSRIGLYVNKNSNGLYWMLSSQYTQPSNIMWSSVWPTQTNTSVPILIGKWFTMDVYLKRGEGSNGRFKITITPDGGQPVVLFDVNNHTVYPGHPELTLKSWQPLKFYFGDAVLDWLRANNKVASVHYNDFKWFKN